MEQWSKKVEALIPELIAEHTLIHNTAVKNIENYAKNRNMFRYFEELVLNHVYKEETWVFAYMREIGIFDEKCEEIASQHQEISALLKELASMPEGEFIKRFNELIEMLLEHHSGEEKYLFPLAIEKVHK
jgi:hemerythrin superfamily protein